MILLFVSIPLMSFSPIGHSLQPFYALASPWQEKWAQTYGGSAADYALSLVQTEDGGYAIVGYTGSFGAGGDDAWLVKVDAASKMQWNRTFGGTGDDYAAYLIQASDRGYLLVGSTDSFGAGSQDFWLVKTNMYGDVQWNQTFGGTGYDYSVAVMQADDGGYVLAGYTDSFGAGNADAWLVKTDLTGNVQWNKTFGGPNYDEVYSVAQVSDGGYILAGATTSSGAGFLDFWIIKTDSLGNFVWAKTFGEAGDDEAYSVAQTRDGGYVVVGYTHSSGAGNYDPWLIKLDSLGNMQWNQTYGGAGNDYVYFVALTSDDGYVLVGATDSFGAGSQDAWLIKTDSSGSMQWNKTFGGAGYEAIYSMLETENKRYVLLGTTSSLGAGNTDYYLIQESVPNLSPMPTLYVFAVAAVIVVVAVTLLFLRRRRAKQKFN